MRSKNFRCQLLLGSTLLAVGLCSFTPTSSFAQVVCDYSAKPNITCSGTATSHTTNYGVSYQGANVSTGTGLNITNNSTTGSTFRSTGTGFFVNGRYGDTSFTDSDTTNSYLKGVRSGLNLYNSFGSSGKMAITLGAKSTAIGGSYGIYTRNYGYSNTITVNGTATATGTSNGYGNSSGILAINPTGYKSGHYTGVNLSVTTGLSSKVTGFNGITAQNYGYGGYTSVTVNGTVTATGASSGIGVLAYNASTKATNLSITTGANSTITGVAFGISATNQGIGTTTITVNGTVTATGTSSTSSAIYGKVGKYATGTIAGANLSITTGSSSKVTGYNGITAKNFGTSGYTSITVNGTVTATGATSGNGIYAHNDTKATNLSITTGASSYIKGAGGIISQNYGTGSTTITANGGVNANVTFGIYAASSASTTNVTVNAGANPIYGYKGGIRVDGSGTGYTAVSVAANGKVTSFAGAGIFARNQNTAGGYVSVTTGVGSLVETYTNGGNAISVYNFGKKANTTLTLNGTVSSQYNSGVYVKTGNYSGNLTITTGARSSISGASGIITKNYGSGSTSITANGTVMGSSYGYGIRAINGSGAANLLITTGSSSNVTGPIGIFADNEGTGTPPSTSMVL